MATFETRQTKAGKRFKVDIRLAGFPRRKATFDSMRRAREWAATEESKMRDGRYGLAAPADQHTVGELVDRYIRNVLPTRSRKKRYLAQVERQLLWWRGQFGVATPLSQITKATVVEGVEELSKSRGNDTVNRYLSAIALVFNRAVAQWEWLRVSPMVDVERLPAGQGRDRYLREQERPGLVDACRMERKKPLLELVVLGIATGGRKNELVTLQMANLRFVAAQGGEQEYAAITQEETKNSRKKTFYVTGWALELLRAYLARRAPRHSKFVFPNRFGKRPVDIEREWTRARQRCGIEDFRFHDLRHTFGSYMAMSGATPRDIAEALNQKTLEMAQRYSHLSPSHVRGKVTEMNNNIFNKGEQHYGEEAGN